MTREILEMEIGLKTEVHRSDIPGGELIIYADKSAVVWNHGVASHYSYEQVCAMTETFIDAYGGME